MAVLKHFDHIFMPIGDGVYLVKCTATGGEFSSILWREGREQNQRCPCCGQQVERRK